MSRDELETEALRLPEDQRVSLAHRLLTSLEPPVSEAIVSAWDTEIRERIAAYDRGEIEAIPAADVFAKLDQRLRR